MRKNRSRRRSVKVDNVRRVKRSRRSSRRSGRSSMRSNRRPRRSSMRSNRRPRRSSMRSNRRPRRSTRRSSRRMRGGTFPPISGMRSAPTLGTKYSGRMPSAWNVSGDNFRSVGREQGALRRSVRQPMDAMSNELIPYDPDAAASQLSRQALYQGTRLPTRRESLNQNLQIAGEEFGSIFSQAQQNFMAGAQEAIANYAVPFGQRLMGDPQAFLSMVMLMVVFGNFYNRYMNSDWNDATQRQPLP